MSISLNPALGLNNSIIQNKTAYFGNNLKTAESTKLFNGLIAEIDRGNLKKPDYVIKYISPENDSTFHSKTPWFRVENRFQINGKQYKIRFDLQGLKDGDDKRVYKFFNNGKELQDNEIDKEALGRLRPMILNSISKVIDIGNDEANFAQILTDVRRKKLDWQPVKTKNGKISFEEFDYNVGKGKAHRAKLEDKTDLVLIQVDFPGCDIPNREFVSIKKPDAPRQLFVISGEGEQSAFRALVNNIESNKNA